MRAGDRCWPCSIRATCRRRRAPRRRSWPRPRPNSAAPAPTRSASPSSPSDQLVSRSTLDAQNAAANAAQGQVNAARAKLDVARNQAAYSQLRAPRDGVIASRQAEAGQVVAAGQTVFTLAADGVREVAFALPEAHDRATSSAGQPVLVELWSQPGQRWPGRIREISPAADPQSRTYAARVTVDAPAGAVELGQSARVYLAAQRQRRR